MFCSSNVFIINFKEHRDVLQAVTARLPLTYPQMVRLLKRPALVTSVGKRRPFPLVAGEERRWRAAMEDSEKPPLLHCYQKSFTSYCIITIIVRELQTSSPGVPQLNWEIISNISRRRKGKPVDGRHLSHHPIISHSCWLVITAENVSYILSVSA